MNNFKETLFFPQYPLKELTEKAEAIVLQAGKLAMQKFEQLKNLKIETKGPGDFVSEADKEVEALIRKELLLAYPKFLVFGEEDGWRGSEGNKQGPVWVLDPIDGTTPFISGLKSWCISLSLCINNIPVIGIVYAAAYKEMYVAYQGGGCSLNNTPIFVHKNKMRKFGIGYSSRTSAKTTIEFINKLMVNNVGFYSNGSAALMLAYVAAGRIAGYFEEHLNSWDCAAGLRLVLEAGGTVVNFSSSHFIEKGCKVLCGYKENIKGL